MSIEEFKFLDKTIPIKKIEDLASTYKIRSYKTKLNFMEEKKIPQMEIIEVLNNFFLKNKSISEKTKKSISKIIYCLKDRIIIAITKHGRDIIVSRDKLIRNYGWFFFVSETDTHLKKKKPKKKKNQSKKRHLFMKNFNLKIFQFL